MPVLVVAALAVALTLWGGDVVSKAADLASRGRRLTNAPAINGVVQASAGELAQAAADTIGRFVAVEAYALARMIRSENGSNTMAAKLAIAWVALNDARALGWGLLHTLTYNRNRQPQTFGEQKGGRYSTARDPFENDLLIAEMVLNGDVADPTGGAVKFVNRTAFGVQEGTRSYADVVASWAADGLTPVELDDVGDLVVFRKTSYPTGIG